MAPEQEDDHANTTGADFKLCRVLQDIGNTSHKNGKPEQMPASEECVQKNV